MFENTIFGKRRNHRVPGLNTTSTADISFMLLIFFLVTTSMDADKGITRELPPIEKEAETTPATVSPGKTLRLNIDGEGRLFCNGKSMRIEALKDSVKAVVGRGGKDHVVQLRTDREAPYNAYFQVQNKIVAAYNDIRNDKAAQVYGMTFNELSPQQKEAIAKAIPQRISETYVEEGGQP